MAFGSVNVPGASDAELKELEKKAQEASNKLGTTNDTGGSASAGTVFGKLNKIITDLATHMGRWTGTRAGYIDDIKADAAETKANAAAIKAAMDGGSAKMGAVKSIQRGIATFEMSSSNPYTLVSPTININTVNPDKCIVLINGDVASSTGSNYSIPSTTCGVYLSSISQEEIVVGSNVRGISGAVLIQKTFSWQVIEFY